MSKQIKTIICVLQNSYDLPKMSEIMFDPRAFCKIMLHAAKYPHLAVNGILLAENGKTSTIADAVPLFHQCLHVSPMAEVALVQVEAKALQKGQHIVGYYVGCENFYDNRFERAPGIRIADKIAESCSNACIAVIDNCSISINMRYPALKMWQYRDNRWSKAKCVVENDSVTFDAVSCLLQRGAAKELHDYDNYLDNTQNDWDNVHLNGDLKQILAMY
ncbi:ER membrane protein complex subunit 8/9 homolog [Anopheles gambiae]|nr:ER membrane protein complex subunit 8/9 homolog [Anopheles gambiae]